MASREQKRDDLLAENDDLRLELAEARAEIARGKADAEAASSAQSTFLANMSHEVRTPMTAVLGYVDMCIEEGTLSKAPPSRVAQLYAIKRSSRHLVHILDDVLDLSRIEAGKLSIECSDVSPFEIVDDVVAIVRHTASSKNLEFAVDYEGRIPERIETDATRLRQILLNLLGNAVKFTKVGGVKLRVRLIADDPTRPSLQFMVSDTGVGIPPDQVQRIFEPFCQADSSTARSFGGAGLGLAISRKLARLLDGDIHLESSEGWGSSFDLRIAARHREGTRLIEIQEFDASGEDDEMNTLAFIESVNDASPGGHILVVEDSDDNAHIIRHALKKAGFHTTRAENGVEAVRLVLSAPTPFDVILMDIEMPIMDGCEATRVLREQGYDLPIMALTAHAMREEREKCLSAGCNEFANKPFDRRDLIEKILALMEKTSSAIPPPS